MRILGLNSYSKLCPD